MAPFCNTLLLILLLQLQKVFTASLSLTNITIDDQFADPAVTTNSKLIYSPASMWKQGSSCGSSCFAQVDSSQAYMGSWHDATTDIGMPPCTVTVQFGGETYGYMIC